LPDYLVGTKKFSVPIYTVWGNHEDISVVEKLKERTNIHNLFLLDEQNTYEIEGIRLCGIGGNFLPGKKLFQKPLAGGGGKIWSTPEEYGTLLKKVLYQS